jgi:hypothetical protein
MGKFLNMKEKIYEPIHGRSTFANINKITEIVTSRGCIGWYDSNN